MNKLAAKNSQAKLLEIMKKIGFILSLVLITVACSSTLAQETKTELRDVTGFNEIDVSEGIRVTLTMGSEEKAEVTTNGEYIEKIITKVDGDVLKIYIEGKGKWTKHKKIEVKVMAKEIKKIHASSGSSIHSTNSIKTEEFKLSVSSGASANLECETNYAYASASSGASMKIKGSTTHFAAKASSGASISGDQLKAKKVKADVSSGAHIKLYADEEIKAEASSGGSIKYSGSPTMKDIHKSSGGSVRSN